MKNLRFIFLASFFFALHTALLAYINSSVLAQYATDKIVGVVYTLASLISLVLVMSTPRILKRLGNTRTILSILCISILSLILLSVLKTKAVLVLFIIYFSLNAVVLYGLDIFLEHYSKENLTGNIRGAYLTLSNIGWVVAPLISGQIESRFGFGSLYFIAALSVCMTFLIIKLTQKKFVDRPYRHSHFEDGFKVLRTNKNIRIVTLLNLALHLFFVMMVIYSPLYLTKVVGFDWKTLGILLSIMLLPFVLFPYPAGKLADKFLGEKELLVGGFLIMAGATLFFAQVVTTSFLFFAIVLFTSRIGASIVETMCESYFFKQVTDDDSSVISIYRNMLPVAYTIGPLLGVLFFMMGSYTLVFTLTAGLMVFASLGALVLKDTK